MLVPFKTRSRAVAHNWSMNRINWSFAITSVLVVTSTTIPFAASGTQQSSSLIAVSDAPSRSIDLSKYFSSRKAAMDELRIVSQAATALSSEPSPNDLGDYLHHANDLKNRTRRLDVYFTILASRNIDDQAARAADQQTDEVSGTVGDKVDAVLRKISERTLAALIQQNPSLRPYQYLAHQAEQEESHSLAPAQQSILDATTQPALSSYWQLYQKIDRLPIGIKTAARAQRISPDRTVREDAWRRHWKIADAKADVDATLLFGIVKQNEAVARLEHYSDAAEAGYASRELSGAEVHASLAAIHDNLSLYQAYQRLNAARLKRALDIANPEPWDMDMLKSGPSPHFPFAEVGKIAAGALAPLGANYVHHFSALLSPSSGRVDVAAKVGNREAGGFSVNALGVPSGLYMATFTGPIDDLRVVIHEGGHSVAAQFANEGGTPSFYARGPNWLMESYAILNEFLLYDYLARTSPSPADRRYYANALLDDMMFQVFGSAEEATLEQAIYEGIASGKIQSAADLDACAYRVMKGFEPWSDDILHTSSALWSRKRLIFQDPFYLVNYMYAGIVAINLYKQAKVDPTDFPARYDALLRRGYDAPPMTLLEPLLGKGTSVTTLTTSAFGVMQNQLEKLSAPTSSIPATPAH